jgi:methionyl-tRNA formyltransferase
MSDTASTWWNRPRRVDVVVDNPSWIEPWACALVDAARAAGDDAHLRHRHEDVRADSIAFYLGCVKITPPATLRRAARNLVVHASDLPRGRGFSPLTWQIIEGLNRIPICLFEAVEAVDAGPVIYRDWIDFRGDELLEELRAPLGDATVRLCRRFLDEAAPPAGIAQVGEPSIYPRRRPIDSRLDPARTLASQFDLLRTVDNERYPAWFELRGRRYKLAILPFPEDEGR